jgi:hypothetical protein
VAADAAVAFASTQGALPPAEAAAVVGDAEAAATAFSASITELDSTDASAVKFAKVTTTLSALVFTTTGLSPQAASYVNAIVAAVTTILSEIHAAQATLPPTPTPPAASSSFVAKVKPASAKLSAADKTKLATLKAQADGTVAKAAAWRAAHPNAPRRPL